MCHIEGERFCLLTRETPVLAFGVRKPLRDDDTAYLTCHRHEPSWHIKVQSIRHEVLTHKEGPLWLPKIANVYVDSQYRNDLKEMSAATNMRNRKASQ